MATIEIHGLSKHFGAVAAVDDLSFAAREGAVTGFLGPNGAGKSTTLRALLGLVRPSAGTATFGGRRHDQLERAPARRGPAPVGGRPYAQLGRPAACVGAVLEDASFHPGRSGRDHLRVLAATGRLPA